MPDFKNSLSNAVANGPSGKEKKREVKAGLKKLTFFRGREGSRTTDVVEYE